MNDYPAWVQPTTRTWCARSGTGPRKHMPRKVLPNTDLCGPCHALFKRVIQDLVDGWPLLLDSEMKRPARVYSDMPRSPSVAPADPSSKWNPAATLVIADVKDWYSFLGRTVKQERPTPADQVAPAVPFIGPLTQAASAKRDNVASRTVFTWAMDGSEDIRLGLAAVVRWHHRWLSHHPAIGADVLDDALKYQWAMNRALEQLPVLRIQLAGRYCQQVMEDTPYGPRLCEGQLVGVIHHQADDRPSAIMCTNYPDHAIPADEWILIDYQP